MEPQHLQFTDSGRARLDEVKAFLEKLSRSKHPQAAVVASEFAERMSQLDDFGGPVSDEDPRRPFRVELGRDFALSFTITWYRLDPSTGEYVYAFNGGLIYHGGSNDPLCVALTPCIWGIHT